MMTRRNFLLALPAMALAPLEQFPGPPPFYGQAEVDPPEGADTPENLTWRVTVLEMALAVQRAAMKEQGDLIAEIMHQFANPWQGWERKARRI